MRNLPNRTPTRKPDLSTVHVLILPELERRKLDALVGLYEFGPNRALADRLAQRVRRWVNAGLVQ